MISVSFGFRNLPLKYIIGQRLTLCITWFSSEASIFFQFENSRRKWSVKRHGLWYKNNVSNTCTSPNLIKFEETAVSNNVRWNVKYLKISPFRGWSFIPDFLWRKRTWDVFNIRHNPVGVMKVIPENFRSLNSSFVLCFRFYKSGDESVFILG